MKRNVGVNSGHMEIQKQKGIYLHKCMLDASGLRQLMQHTVIINSNQIQLCRRDTVFPCVSS